MKELTHITVGRIAFKILLVAVVLTAVVVGPTGTAAASLDGKGNDPYPLHAQAISFQDSDLYALDIGFQDMDPYFLAVVDQDMDPY